MPEYRECLASNWMLALFILLQLKLELRHVLNFWADPTEQEINEADAGTTASQGLVTVLCRDLQWKRGGGGNTKELLYPIHLAHKDVRDYNLIFQGTQFNPRNAIMNFGGLWLQVSVESLTGPSC